MEIPTAKQQVETNWALIPSDPDIFNDMLREYGITEAAVQEAYSVTFDGLIDNSPVYGIIYASRYDDDQLPQNIEQPDDDSDEVIFTSQIVTNACATIALLSILLNADIEKGEIIKNFAEFTDSFSPINRGIALGNSPEIRQIHNAYAIGETRANTAMQSDALATTNEYIDDDNFHFVSYIVKNGYIWELDGLKIRPVKLAPIKPDEHWLKTLQPILTEKMLDQVQCSIMVVTNNPLFDMKNKLEKCTNKMKELKSKTEVSRKEEEQASREELRGVIDGLKRDIHDREGQVEMERIQMIKQKFDYFPFLHALAIAVRQQQQENQISLPSPPIPEFINAVPAPVLDSEPELKQAPEPEFVQRLAPEVDSAPELAPEAGPVLKRKRKNYKQEVSKKRRSST